MGAGTHPDAGFILRVSYCTEMENMRRALGIFQATRIILFTNSQICFWLHKPAIIRATRILLFRGETQSDSIPCHYVRKYRYGGTYSFVYVISEYGVPYTDARLSIGDRLSPPIQPSALRRDADFEKKKFCR